MTSRAARDFNAEAEARTKLLALAHQHVVTARALIDQAAALTVTNVAAERPVVQIVAYRPGEGPRP